MKELATRCGMPLVYLAESTGVRMPDVMGGTGMGSRQRQRPASCASARVRGSPRSSATPSARRPGTRSSDFAVFRKGAVMAVSSPGLVAARPASRSTREELGGWKLHAEVTGFADAVADTDEEAIELIRRFLSYLPSHNGEAPPVVPIPPGSGERAGRAQIHRARVAHPDLRRAQGHRHRRRHRLRLPDQGGASARAS